MQRLRGKIMHHILSTDCPPYFCSRVNGIVRWNKNVVITLKLCLIA